MNGADNVTIDGRLNQSGTTIGLTIVNESTSSASGTSTIRFINDATLNKVKYCNIKGSSLSTFDGVVDFSETTGTTGNDNNTIEYNNITNCNGNRPLNAVYSLGTAGKDNNTISIANNHLYDFLNPSNESNGVNLLDGTTSCSVTGNSFFETTAFVNSAEVNYYMIHITNGGTNFLISGNYLGGNGPSCTGTWNITSKEYNIFDAIFFEIITNDITSNTISNNTIRGFDYSSSSYFVFQGVSVYSAGETSITGNVVGAETGNNSFVLESGGNSSTFMGIFASSKGEISDNLISSVTLQTSNPTDAFNFYGILF